MSALYNRKVPQRMFLSATTVLLVSLLFIAVYPEQGRGATCLDLPRTLALNSQGSDVSSLQQFLKDNAGYTGAISGNFGPRTRTAVGAWQLQKGIVPNSQAPGYGTVGPKTRAALACTKTPPPTTFSRTLDIGARGGD